MSYPHIPFPPPNPCYNNHLPPTIATDTPYRLHDFKTWLIILFISFVLAGTTIQTLEPHILPEVAIEITLPELVQEPVKEQEIKHVEPQDARVMCNCYNIIKTQFEHVPFMHEIIASASMDSIGNVAVFMYPPNEDFPHGMPHVALVLDVLPDGSVKIGEYHYSGCSYTERIIDSTTRGLMGYVTL